MRTTVGQLLVNEALPVAFRDYDRVMTKGETDAVLARLAREKPEEFRAVSHRLAGLGRNAAFEEGVTLRLSDIGGLVEKKEILDGVERAEDRIDADKLSTADEKRLARDSVYADANETLKEMTFDAAIAADNPFALQVKSKARGNPDQLAAMLTTPGVYQDGKDRTIPVFIRHSYAEGLSPHEYWAATYGARKGVVSSKFCLGAGTEVLMADFTAKPIEAVRVGEFVFAFDLENRLVPTVVTGVSENGPRVCYRYTFVGADGGNDISVVATPRHRVLISDNDGRRRMLALGRCVGGSESAVFPCAPNGERWKPPAGFAYCKDETFVGETPTFDLEVAHASSRFVLACGLVVSNSTRQAGYLGKLFGMAVMDSVVTEDDCGSPYGLPVPADDTDNIGSVLARPIAGFAPGVPVDRAALSAFKSGGVDEIVVRSPITCGTKKGVCKLCVGVREHGELPPLGYHIGLNAASAMAEQIAQASLNVKHSGKKVGGHTVYSGFDTIKNLATVPRVFPDRATVAEIDGEVDRIEEAPQGGHYVYVGDRAHYVPMYIPITVKAGDKVESGDRLSDGVTNPADVVRLKGLGEGRRYFADRLTQAFRDSRFTANRRNVEVLARSIVNHVQVDDPDAAGGHLPGDVVTYSSWASGYRPRAEARRLAPRNALGKYLEEPALHYTIGTRVTPSVADRLRKHGTVDVLAHDSPVGVSPVSLSVVKTPEYTEDWMARLGSSYLKTRLLEDTHMGAKSEVHGVNPIPGIARGVEFGGRKGTTFTY